ncbi:MAG: hypothetical protein IPH28_22420 [Cytophagaceae bacterium]|nr:hypothetical protein [Cytophagaceae bacterium]
MKTIIKKISVLAVMMLLFQSCGLFNKDEIKPASNEYKINLGTFTQVASSSVPNSGGIVNVSTGDLKGMTITVPKGAFSGSRQFTISTTDATSSEFGQYIKPLSPIIKIENGGGYSNGIMFLKIPAKLPQGHFPMAYFVDATNGKIEPIPVEYYDDNSVTITTRHFSSSTLMNSQGLKKAKAGEGFANIMISSIAESVFKDIPVVNSGFKLGIDDWEFVNYGSYIAPGGHCAGQNFAAMYYYFEKKKTEGNLFNKYNTLSNIQEENALGYRLCSVIQNDLDWEGTLNNFYWKNIDLNRKVDKLKMYSIAGAILTTGEPQAIGIYRVKGIVNGFSDMGGHALICYKVDISAGKLFISDPNTPNTAQNITLAGENFNPYVAKANGQDSDHSYPYITHHAKTAHIEWSKIGQRWSEVTSKKIGTVAPNTFPEYQLWVNDGSGYEIGDSLNTDLDTLRLLAICPSAENWNNYKGKKSIGVELYDEKGTPLKTEGTGINRYILLKPGLNKIGVYIYGWRNGNIDKNNKLLPKYIDFKWIKVVYEKTVSFEYWLKGKRQMVMVHFGALKEEDVEEGVDLKYTGTWSGNTFKVDKKLVYDEGTIVMKITAVANANKTVLNTFNVESWIEGGGQKWVMTSLDGKNLPLKSSDNDYLIFGAEGTATCQYFTRVDFEFWGGVTEWSCDETSFVKFKIPKP